MKRKSRTELSMKKRFPMKLSMKKRSPMKLSMKKKSPTKLSMKKKSSTNLSMKKKIPLKNKHKKKSPTNLSIKKIPHKSKYETPPRKQEVRFIGGGNCSTQRKPLTCHKTLTNLIAQICMTKYITNVDVITTIIQLHP